MDKLQGTPAYDRLSLLQPLRGVGFLSAVVLIAEMGSFDLFPSPKKLYAYFGLDPAVKQSSKSNGDKVNMSKRGASLARRILHMAALNNLKVDKGTKSPVNPVIYDYYIYKCIGKKKNVAIGAVMYKICNIIFAMFRDNKPLRSLLHKSIVSATRQSIPLRLITPLDGLLKQFLNAHMNEFIKVTLF